MQNVSQNLFELIEDLKFHLDKKIYKIGKNKLGEVAKIEARIKALEVYQVEIEGLYSTNENMLLNFRKRVNDIKSDISHL